MHRNRQSIWKSGIKSIALCSASGLAVTILCTAFFAAFIFLAMDDMSLGNILAVLSSTAGAYIGAYICGKHRRSRGLAEGMACGIIIYAVLSTAAIASGTWTVNIKMLLRLAVSGAVGGVCGVNSKRPKNLRD